MNEDLNFHKVRGEEKDRYLSMLDRSLEVLAQGLVDQDITRQKQVLSEFGKENEWDWGRLPGQEQICKSIAKNVERIRQEYLWFHTLIDPKDPEQNRGYFDEIGISKNSGMPWIFNFVTLNRLKREIEAEFGKLPSYVDAVKELKKTVLEDYVDVDDVEAKLEEIHKGALKRSFLEQLADAELLRKDSSATYTTPEATKIKSMGAEELWNITYMKLNHGTGTFEIYSIDLWQDNREQHITEDAEGTKVSERFRTSLSFSQKNHAWYILRRIDQNFKSLHPVHVTRATVGPFENKYLTATTRDTKLLSPVQRILETDAEAGVLRFTRQYSLAPNHNEIHGKLRQEVYQKNWSDEIIVCPGKYSSTLGHMILGTDVKIFER